MALEIVEKTLNSSYKIIFAVLFLIGLSITAVLILISEDPKGPVPEQTFVSKVISGDEILLNTGDKIVLACIDAPDFGEINYYRSKNFLEHLLLLKPITLEEISNNTEKKTTALIYVNNTKSKIFINKEMVNFKLAKSLESEKCQSLLD